MNTNLKSRAAFAVTSASLVAATVALAASAAQAAPPPAPSGVRHCVVVLEKLRAGESNSRIASRHCAASPEAADQQSRLADPSAPDRTLLIVLYDGRNYRGDSTRIEGKNGPCDKAGYGISDLSSWSNRTTSFKRFNFCQWVRGYDAPNYGAAAFGPWTHNTTYVGSAADNRMNSLLLRRL